MAKVLVTESYLTGIADAIRSKNGTSDTYTPSEMSEAILNIPTGGNTYTLENIVPSQSITTNLTTSNYSTGGLITSYTALIVQGEWYLVTYDGIEYILQCYLASSNEFALGDYRIVASNTSVTYLSTPFVVEYNASNGYFFLACRNTNTHTLQVDKMTLQ